MHKKALEEKQMHTVTDLITLTPIGLDAGEVFGGSPSGKTVKGYAAKSLAG